MKVVAVMSKEKEPNMEVNSGSEVEQNITSSDDKQNTLLPKTSYSDELIQAEDGCWYHNICYMTEPCEGCGPLPEYKEY